MRGCFLFVRIGLRLPRLRIGKCPTAFCIYRVCNGAQTIICYKWKEQKDMPAFSLKAIV